MMKKATNVKNNTVVKSSIKENKFALLNESETESETEHESEHELEPEIKLEPEPKIDEKPKEDDEKGFTYKTNHRDFSKRFKNYGGHHEDSTWSKKKYSKAREIYNEEMSDTKDMGDDKKLNNYWTVWVHSNTNEDWKLSGYQKIYTINSWGGFWRFFNNIQSFDQNYHIFVMREEISPIWEDHNNKQGGICSLKLDSTQKGYKTDISIELLTIICLLALNETLITDGKNINGIEFSVKKRSSHVKIWTKKYQADKDMAIELPKALIDNINTELEKINKNGSYKDNKLSILCRPIKPEYEL